MNTNTAEAGTRIVPDNEVRTRIVRWCLYLFMSWVVSGLVLNATLTTGYFHNQKRVDFGDMVYGEAARPFVARVATFAAVRAGTAITPEAVKAKIHSVWVARDIEEWTGFPPENATEGLWALLLMHLCVIGFMVVLRELQRTFYGLDEFVSSAVALVGGAAVPLLRPYFMYDFTVLFLFPLALLLMVKSRWWLYYLVFVVVCFTKETGVILPFLLFLLLPKYREKLQVMGHVVFQGAIWAGVYLLLQYAFQANQGSALEFHLLGYNAETLTSPRPLVTTTHYLVPDRSNILLLGLVAVLTFHRFREKPVFLRWALAMTVPLFVLLALFGWIDEMRTYYEVFAVFFLLIQYSVMKLFGYHFAPNRELLPSFK
ncbi:hypothetical protein GF356_12130 [candidate division GN15 bacterium]|nr:hypothetical protein [candidate division GN15 bacterium]